LKRKKRKKRKKKEENYLAESFNWSSEDLSKHDWIDLLVQSSLITLAISGVKTKSSPCDDNPRINSPFFYWFTHIQKKGTKI